MEIYAWQTFFFSPSYQKTKKKTKPHKKCDGNFAAKVY